MGGSKWPPYEKGLNPECNAALYKNPQIPAIRPTRYNARRLNLTEISMRKTSALLCALAFLFASTAFAAGFSSVEERMSQSEFHAAGLDKLSPEELKMLDDWLRTHYATTTTYVTPSGSPVFYPKQGDRETIEAHINGHFSGWSGSSTFALDNGQEWKQAESGGRACGSVDNPKIKIKPMLMGSWLAYIESCSDSVRVERVK